MLYTMASKCASKTLFVGNLHVSLEESDLLDIFRPFGRIVECCKRWCHYGFIQFATEDEARLAFNNLNGSKVRGRPMRIEFQRKKLRNIQALIEAEAEAKLHMQNNDGGGGSGGGSSSVGCSGNKLGLSANSSLEHLNLLVSLNNANHHHSSSITLSGLGSNGSIHKNFSSGILCANSNNVSAITTSNSCASNIENMNPLIHHHNLMNVGVGVSGGSGSSSICVNNANKGSCQDLGLYKLSSLFRNNTNSHQIPSPAMITDDDEMLLFSNSTMLLETCLLKVFDDEITPDESSRKPVTSNSTKDVLKSICLNTNIFSSNLSLMSNVTNTNRLLNKSPPDYNNNSNKNFKSTSRLNDKHIIHDCYLSSSCSSPVSQKDSSSSSSSSSFSSVIIPAFKCKSSSAATSIYVEPNETNLEPLTEKDYPQYRLFPIETPAITTTNATTVLSVNNFMDLDDDTDKKLTHGFQLGAVGGLVPSLPEDRLFSPPLPLSSCPSSSPTSSCCSHSTSSSLNSPDYSSSLQRRSSPFANNFFPKII